MLDKIVNGYTIIAQEFVPGHGYIILGHRTVGPLGHEYVTAWMQNLDDSYWYSGDYSLTLSYAIKSYTERAGIVMQGAF